MTITKKYIWHRTKTKTKSKMADKINTSSQTNKRSRNMPNLTQASPPSSPADQPSRPAKDQKWPVWASYNLYKSSYHLQFSCNRVLTIRPPLWGKKQTFVFLTEQEVAIQGMKTRRQFKLIMSGSRAACSGCISALLPCPEPISSDYDGRKTLLALALASSPTHLVSLEYLFPWEQQQQNGWTCVCVCCVVLQ